MSTPSALCRVGVLLISSGLLLACRAKSAFRKPDPELNRMLEVPRYDIYEAGPFFDNGMTMREPPRGTVSYRSRHAAPDGFWSGKAHGGFLTEFPIDIDAATIERGRGRYERTCAACHGMSGYGNTAVTRHMQRPAPSLHEKRLRELLPGKVFTIVSNGYGFMPDYAAKLSTEDRWAVVAYVKVLELSQYAPIAELPEQLRQKLERRLH